jgi:hypothetical protein
MAGDLTIDGVGGHAWVEINYNGRDYILETTQPELPNPFLPAELMKDYSPLVAFDENAVYTVRQGIDVAGVINARFGVCAIPFLEEYICERCLQLEG